MKKNIFAIGITTLFVLSIVSPIVFGYGFRVIDKERIVEEYNVNSYHVSEISNKEKHIYMEYPVYDNIKLEDGIIPVRPTQPLDGPMDSPWSMYCHDVRHSGRSPYSTVDNPGTEKWRFDTIEVVAGSPVIGDDGVIYIGANDLFAVYPNGTLKWKYDYPHKVWGAPAIDEDGIIYFGTAYAMPNYLYAVYITNGTLKWKYRTGSHIHGSPAIGDDGTIYFGNDESGSPPYSGYIVALYPNGTLKWRYKTNHFIYSSPAIGNDGTIYCGSHDGNLYALYPNNGTLKWKYYTGGYVGRGPSIAEDETIYFGSWDGYVYAVYPNGTLKWKTGGNLASTTPITGLDGIIYVGNQYLTALYPSNGSIKWQFNPGGDTTIRGGNPCISADGIIYFGTHIGESSGGDLIAVNSDGTERWRIRLATDWIWSAPAIGADGTIYVGSWNDGYHPGSWGYLHAIGKLDPDAPYAPTINGQTSGKPGKEYEYTFKSISPLGRDVYYYIEWGDGDIIEWDGPYSSGEQVKVTHAWSNEGTYTIKARAKDTENLWGPWGELEVNMPRNKIVTSPLFQRFLEQFPLLERFLSLLIE